MSQGLSQLLAVATGGALGSVARWLLSLACQRWLPGFPAGTLLVNSLGSFAAGAVLAWLLHGPEWPPLLRLFVVTGLLGGLTTFSAFSLETTRLWLEGSPRLALLNLGLNLGLGLLAVSLGYGLLRTLWPGTAA